MSSHPPSPPAQGPQRKVLGVIILVLLALLLVCCAVFFLLFYNIYVADGLPSW